MAEVGAVLSASSLEDAARLIAAQLGPGTTVWMRRPDGPVRRLTGPDSDVSAPSSESGTPIATAVTADDRTVEVHADTPDAELAAVLLAGVADRLAAVEETALVRQRLDDNERIGSLGSYDWDIRADVNDWSDELFRIYGFEPGAFVPTYEGFISLLHPDDRDRIRAVHRRAHETGEPYETEERIIRPDGDERTLWTYGEVIRDESGDPVRMLGVCRDVTEQRRSEQRAERAAARMSTLVRAAPDAIVLVDAEGVIAAANPSAVGLFGHTMEELVGMPVERLVPEAARGRHAADRAAFLRAPLVRPMAAGRDLSAHRADGSEVPVDIALAPIDDPEGAVVAAFVRDATVRRQAEADRRWVAEAEQRRRQALELNDNVVQGLVTLLWSLGRGDDQEARRLAERTLAAARRMMNDLLTDAPVDAGGLVRTAPAAPRTTAPSSGPAGHGARIPIDGSPPDPEPPGGGLRVLLADDASDLRLLMRRHMGRVPGVEVVAEACDGREAVDLAARHQPDVVVLDLGMPRLDGLEAANAIRALAPSARIVVLSGYPASSMRDRALGAGADEYLEKSGDLAAVVAAIVTPAAV